MLQYIMNITLLYWKKSKGDINFRHDWVTDWLCFSDYFPVSFIYLQEKNSYICFTASHLYQILSKAKRSLLIKHFRKESWNSVWLSYLKSSGWGIWNISINLVYFFPLRITEILKPLSVVLRKRRIDTLEITTNFHYKHMVYYLIYSVLYKLKL